MKAAVLTVACMLGHFAVAAQAQTKIAPNPAAGAVAAGAELSLSMNEAVDLGVQNSFRMARSSRFDEMAELRLKSARAQYLPRVDLSANVNNSRRQSWYTSPLFSYDSPATSTLQAGLTAIATLQLDISGTIGRQVKQAELARDSSALNLRQSTIDIGADIRTVYVEALRAQGAVDADEALVRQLQTLLINARERLPDAVRYLEVEMANAQQLLSASRSSADIAQSGLKQQLRLAGETRLRLTTRLDPKIPPIDRQTLMDRAISNRSDVRDAQLRLQQAQLSLEQVRDSRKPSANIFAYMNATDSGTGLSNIRDTRYQSTAVMLNVYIPLWVWDGGMMDNSARTAMLSRDQARDDIDEQKDRIALELRQLLISLDQASRRLASLPSPTFAHGALMQAEKSLLEGGQQGQAQLAQVTNARNAWRLAQTASIDALADYYSAYYRLRRSVGENE